MMKLNNLPGSQLTSRWNTSFDKQTTHSLSQKVGRWSSDTWIEKTNSFQILCEKQHLLQICVYMENNIHFKMCMKKDSLQYLYEYN